MTTVEVVYGYTTHPSEAEMLALGAAREVYGIRRIVLSQMEMTIRVEYDATRLSTAVVCQLLRRAGISITGEVAVLPTEAYLSQREAKKGTATAK